MQFLPLFHFETAVVVIGGLLLCLLIGIFISGKRYALGMGSSLLILVAASDLAYFLCFYLHLSSTVFITLFIFLFVTLVIFFKKTYQHSLCALSRSDVSFAHNLVVVFVFVVVSTAIFIYSTLVAWDASAASHFFQAWYPLYSAYVGTAASFNFPEGVNLTPGFLLSAQYYSPNSLGIVLLGSTLGLESPKDLFYLYNGTCILATILTFNLLMASLSTKRSVVPALLFATLFALFCAFDYDFRLVLIGNFGDEVLYLAGALVCYFLAGSDDYLTLSKRYSLIILAASFMVFGRNYGLFFVGSIALFYGVLIFRSEQKAVPSSFGGVMVTLVDQYKFMLIVITAFCLKEMIQLLLYGATYPRSNLHEIVPYTTELFHAGLINGLKIGYFKDGFSFNVHSMYLIALCFALFNFVMTVSTEKKIYAQLVLMPLLMLFLPFILELLTQYRKSMVFSKLYVPFIWFSVWYVAYFCRISFVDKHKFTVSKRHSVVALAYIVSLTVFVSYALWKPHYRFDHYMGFYAGVKRGIDNKLKGFVQYKRHENIILDTLKASLTDSELNDVIKRPVMYFHYEPGLGFRYFVGGDITNDYDFYSHSVQAVLKNSESAIDFFCQLNLPSILIYANLSSYIAHTDYLLPQWFETELWPLLQDKNVLVETTGLNLKFYRFNQVSNQICH